VFCIGNHHANYSVPSAVPRQSALVCNFHGEFADIKGRRHDIDESRYCCEHYRWKPRQTGPEHWRRNNERTDSALMIGPCAHRRPVEKWPSGARQLFIRRHRHQSGLINCVTWWTSCNTTVGTVRPNSPGKIKNLLYLINYFERCNFIENSQTNNVGRI